ncbi:23S rRNA (guanine(2445)-N(2))-methyltransferase / 23S rRNA (guanine(2069)-N(7))-methyltransferase [hydrothermal vent metagenome]|uniref:23S rRNA (Guanine(2445)-N(2))-methyltransferase / 23S rRNA (Guanine(2069)-N(7))-methyltransferase n=1 Tax=hydrothermal vent metagenome TaxID=652676 RepID=A0A3B0YH32_9ZZZZ
MPANQITLSDSATMFANRLSKKRSHFRKWLSRECINAYRVYDADIPEYALAIDVYNTTDNLTHVVVYEYQAPATVNKNDAALRLKEALTVIQIEFSIPTTQLYLKIRKKQKGIKQYEKIENEKCSHKIIEGGSLFLVNFRDYLDTGLFFDHRKTRALIRAMASDKRFLNLFAYTGSVSVYAAQGGAKSTLTIDMSNTYLDIAKSNMSLNGYKGDQHQFIQADCLQWLQRQHYANEKYDIIFLDPPAFSTSKRMKSNFDVLRDHATIIRQCMSILSPDGTLIFSNNSRKFKMNEDLLQQYEIKNISKKTIPKDFEANRQIHNSWDIQHP